jgi:hypothetical protein
MGSMSEHIGQAGTNEIETGRENGAVREIHKPDSKHQGGRTDRRAERLEPYFHSKDRT